MLEYLYQALRSNFGIAIDTDDFELTRQKLYRAKRDAADKDLDCLSFVQSPTTPNQLWIVKK